MKMHPLPDEIDWPWKFVHGQCVSKVKGYLFPGVVVARFLNLQGLERYVVECTAPDVKGILHVYNPEDLRAE